MQQRVINEHVLLEQLGSNALWTVYKAQQTNTNKTVALKLLRPYISSDEAFLQKLSSAVTTATTLDHPNILSTISLEFNSENVWISSEYSAWPTLRHWIQHPIPISQTILILQQISSAIEYAKTKGVSHGDIKPGNIFIDSESGIVKLSDFGLTQASQGVPESMRTATKIPLPTYTAPERGYGNSDPSFLSDIYSLGVLAYDMLTGSVPFNAIDRSTVLARQMTSVPVTPSIINPNIPPQIDRIILKALSPHPEIRFQTASEFLDALVLANPNHDDQTSTSTATAIPSTEESLVSETTSANQSGLTGTESLCTVCGHSNAHTSKWCSNCWGRLIRVAAIPGQDTMPELERNIRWHKSNRLRRSTIASTVAAVLVITSIQFLNITVPIGDPLSNIDSTSGPGEWGMVNRYFEGPGPIDTETLTDQSGNISIQGSTKWTFKTSDRIMSTPAVKYGNIYVGTRDNRILALDKNTGSLVWQYESPVQIDSSPAVGGGMVFIGTHESNLLALDAQNGEIQWRFTTSGNPTIGSPIVKNGVVYFGSGDSNLYAIDALTGTKIWSQKTEDWITNTPAISGHTLALASLDGRVTTYDINTGKKRFTFMGFNNMVMASPIIADNSIYVPYRHGILTSINLDEEEVLFQSRLYRLQIQLWIWAMGKHPGYPKGVNWVKRLGTTVDTTPAADSKNIYLPTLSGALMSVDRETGNNRWVFRTLTESVSTPTIVGDSILITDSTGKLYIIDKNNGNKQWEQQIAEASTTTPVISDGIIYLASEDGTIYAIE